MEATYTAFAGRGKTEADSLELQILKQGMCVMQFMCGSAVFFVQELSASQSKAERSQEELKFAIPASAMHHQPIPMVPLLL